MNGGRWMKSMLVLIVVVGVGMGLAAWKYAAVLESRAASANVPEPMEVVKVAVAKAFEHRPTTTSIGTVVAIRSITLRNELAGTVRQVNLTPGQVVEPGTVLVALDVSVEEAELKALQTQASLAKTVLNRRVSLSRDLATAQEEVDRARADLDVILAQMSRIKAIIARKKIFAPFRARVGIADVHPGQYLNEGTQLTTLQGVDDAVHVDFSVPQQVAEGLHPGDGVRVFTADHTRPIEANIVALDARIDPSTRNALVRARIDHAAGAPAPGASVRVQVQLGSPRKAVTVPVSAVRKGPEGDQVFVIEPDDRGKPRAHVRTVESGAMLGDDVVIHAGLTAGERVAASGSFKLRDNVLVALADDATVNGKQAQIAGNP